MSRNTVLRYTVRTSGSLLIKFKPTNRMFRTGTRPERTTAFNCMRLLYFILNLPGMESGRPVAPAQQRSGGISGDPKTRVDSPSRRRRASSMISRKASFCQSTIRLSARVTLIGISSSHCATFFSLARSWRSVTYHPIARSRTVPPRVSHPVCFFVRFGKNRYGGFSGLYCFQRSGMSRR